MDLRVPRRRRWTLEVEAEVEVLLLLLLLAVTVGDGAIPFSDVDVEEGAADRGNNLRYNPSVIHSLRVRMRRLRLRC